MYHATNLTLLLYIKYNNIQLALSDLQHTLQNIRQQTSDPNEVRTVDEAIAHASHHTALVVGEAHSSVTTHYVQPISAQIRISPTLKELSSRI